MMLKRKLRYAIGLILIISMFCSATVFAADTSSGEEVNAQSISSTEKEIQFLFDERATILNNIFSLEDEQLRDLLTADLNTIDLKLARLGVTFLSQAQVVEQFPETKCDKLLSLSGQTQSDVQKENTLRVVTPTSSNNTWASYRSTYVSGGVTYNIQRLVAQPRSSSSPLTNSGSRIVTFSTNWAAGTTNAISSLAESAVGLIPGSTLALTIYDAASSFISGLSTTTEVSAPNITYSWSNVTTAVFTYVRQDSQSDDYQWLSLISTKTETEVGYDIPTFSYKQSNGSWVLSPTVIQGKRTIYATPSGYDSNSAAVNAYKTVSGGPVHNAVSNIQISGPESKSVQTIWPCYPNFPLQCE